MIIILSTENDFTTIEVINWLTRYKVKHTVLYANDFLTNATFENLTSEGIQKYIEEKIQCALSEVKVVWCRKWGVKSIVRENFLNELEFENNKAVYISSLAEIEEINSLLLSFFPKEKVINSFLSSKASKLNQLLIANKVGLKSPTTKVLSRKTQLEEFMNEAQAGLITKPMHEVLSLKIHNEFYTTFTSRVKTEQSNSDFFLPSMFQTEIKKKFEVRTFVFGDQFYSMAIFSQSNKQTEVDFRKYDQQTPNRNAKYKLPSDIQNRIQLLFKELQLETGSVDLIVDQNDQHIFLEVNPYGQFGMVSKPHNYNLEQKFAKYLMNYEPSN